MGKNKFSQFYGKPAKSWVNTKEGKDFANYLEDMVNQRRFEQLSESEKLCWEDYTKFKSIDKFKVLYDKPAPWKDEELGSEFRNYLKDADSNNKKLSDAEKRCLNDLKNWEKEHPEESADLETGATFSLDTMRWVDIRTASDVAYFLNGLYFPSKENKNTAAYVQSEWESGKGILTIANYAEQMYQRQVQNAIAEKTGEKDIDGVAGKLQAGLRNLHEDPMDNLNLKDRIVIIAVANKVYQEKNPQKGKNEKSGEQQEQLKSKSDEQPEIDIEEERKKLEEERKRLEEELEI